MTKEERDSLLKEITDFVEEEKFRARGADGWSFWCDDVVRVDDIKRKLKNISRRKIKQVNYDTEKQ